MYRFVVRPWRGPDRRHATVKDAFDNKKSDDTVWCVLLDSGFEVRVVRP